MIEAMKFWLAKSLIEIGFAFGILFILFLVLLLGYVYIEFKNKWKKK